ncbi:class I SAM-dependent RNA methyltransferase [soil metagenome]
MIGEQFDVTIGSIAHGGHCVAHVDGRVVFVRHGLPGERARIVITGGNARIMRADVVEVLEESADRVVAPCAYAGRCGGCDFQHVAPDAQRRLLAAVVEDQLKRLAGIDRSVHVEAVSDSALGWRTRVTYAVGADKKLGLHKHRSHDVVDVDACLIAHEDLPPVLQSRWPARSVEAIASSRGEKLVVVDRPNGRLPKLAGVSVSLTNGTRVSGSTHVTERVKHRDFRVTGSGFWQVHPAAATTLVDAVMGYAAPARGERVADLYAGVGLFTAFLAEAVGDSGGVFSVESDPGAARDAKRNMHDLPHVRLVSRDVDSALTDGHLPSTLDLVVLDPPRTGAKKSVPAIAALRPDRIVYVACDPAALARDLALFAEHGYGLSDLRAFALFPMTQHVECVALLRPQHLLGG